MQLSIIKYFHTAYAASRHKPPTTPEPSHLPELKQETLTPHPWPLATKIPWRRKWQPTPLFLPGEFHEQRRLAGYSPLVAESDTTEGLTLRAEWYSTICLDYISLVHVSVHRHLDCFHFGAIMNSCVWMWVYKYLFETLLPILWGTGRPLRYCGFGSDHYSKANIAIYKLKLYWNKWANNTERLGIPQPADICSKDLLWDAAALSPPP